MASRFTSLESLTPEQREKDLTMKTGKKAQGNIGHNSFGKLCVRRHGSHFSKSTAHRCEKTFETGTRRLGKKACKETD